MGSVLIVSKHGDGVPLALKLQQEGHIAKVWIKDKEARSSLENYKNPVLIKDIEDPEQFDLILFDMVGLGKAADKMMKQSLNIVGGSSVCDKMELDREYGEKICQKLSKLDLPKSEKHTTIGSLTSTIESSKVSLVVKPLDNASPMLSLVSMNSANSSLMSMVKSLGNKLLPCITQEKIDGVEVSTEGWFNGERFEYFNHTIEYKRFMEGNLGPNTGCMGNVVWSTGSDKLVEEGLLGLKPLLGKAGYIGPIDVNAIVTEDKAYFLEYTARFGYDAIQAWCELIKGSLFDFLWRLFTKDKPLQIRDDYSIAVRLSMPPYPTVADETQMLKGVQVLNLQDGARRHTYLADVRKNQDGTETLAGVDGVIGCITARGTTIHEVRRRVYRTINNCVINSDVQYRRDIGAGVEASIDKLKTWGWLDA